MHPNTQYRHRMKKIVCLILIAVAVTTACQRNSDIHHRLQLIDSLLVHDLVDSAYNSLAVIGDSPLPDASDSAYFFLLQTQADYRMYLPTNAVRLDYCIDHYERQENNTERLATAYFYKASTLYAAGNVRQALSYLKRAEVLVERQGSLELRHKIYELFVVVNEEAGEHRTALDYSRKSVAVSQQAENANWLAHAYNNMAVLLSRTNQADSSAVYLKRCMELMPRIPGNDRSYILNNIGAYLSHTNPTLAKRYLYDVLKEMPMAEAYDNLAQIYANEGDDEKAELLWMESIRKGRIGKRGEVMHSFFRHLVRQGDYLRAISTAERLITLKDSLSEHRADINVKAIQAEFDHLQRQQEFERKTSFGIVLIVFLALVAIIALLYSRYKVYKTKVSIAHDQMLIQDYENRIHELQLLGKDKEKEIEAINRRKEKLITSHRNTLNRGYTLYTEACAEKTTVLWAKKDFECVVEYYRLVDVEFVDSLERGYHGLTPKQQFFLILEHMGKTDTEIMSIMAVAEVSLRSIRSRVNKKKLQKGPTV